MPIQIVVPELGESIVEATVGKWLKKQGDPVRVGEPIVELETDKVNLEVGAEKDGILSRIERQKGDDVKIGDVLGIIDDGVEKAAPPDKSNGKTATPTEMPEPKKAEAAATPSAIPSTEKVTPVARRMAEDLGVDLAQVPASGLGSRVTKDDVQRYVEHHEPAHTEAISVPAPTPKAVSAIPTPTLEIRASGREERVKLSRRRRTIAQRLVEAQQTAAMLTTFNELDMTAVMAIRDQRKVTFKERHGVNLGFTSFFVKAVIGALKDFPRLNAELDGDEIIIKKYYDIGIAVGSAEGLVVPVLRDADRMSFSEIETNVKRFAQQSDAGTLSLEDLRGGTFTITNGGVFGSMLSTPILNMPQVGILGLHKIEQRPVVINNQIVIRSMMYAALTYDHRIVDGRESVQFLVRIKELIEDPTSLLIEG
ncbi:MAG: 2-oxoglutarate dehydrogenase complex dihydrolipoyllysine-residue succinyltransferase [Chloroflexota bacterium]